MKKRFIFLVVFMLATSLFFLPNSALGDAGNFSGGSDYGGSSAGSSSSSDSYSFSSSSSDGPLGSFFISCLSVTSILIVGYALSSIHEYIVKRKEKKGPSGGPVGAAPTPASQLLPFADLLAKDPSFSAEVMAIKVADLYKQMQHAWTAKDFTPMRPYFSDELYTQFDRQLDAYRQQHQTNYVVRIAVLGVDLQGWYETETYDCIVALVKTRIVDYVLDDNTSALISGSTIDEKLMTYEYTLIRTKCSVTSAQVDQTETMDCPNCGAALNINATDKCPYCGSIVSAKDFNWVISQIKGISQTSRK